MIVILHAAIFEAEDRDDATLVEIICGHADRYKLRTRPAWCANSTNAVNHWLDSQSDRIKDRAVVALERGLKAAEYCLPDGSSEPTLIVESRQNPHWPSRFTAGPVRLAPADACLLLREPAFVLLENGRNDWGFLNQIVPTEWREVWQLFVDRRWIQPKNAGGIGEMYATIRQQIGRDHKQRLKTFALFDSDGRKKGEVSSPAARVSDACAELGVAYHRLERRAIENYIPKATLFEWARRSPRSRRSDMHHCALKFSAMSSEQRHYFNLKKGLNGDIKSNQGLSEIYAHDVAVLADEFLQAGFDESIAQDIWGCDENGPNAFRVPDQFLEADGFGPERVELFQHIFSWI